MGETYLWHNQPVYHISGEDFTMKNSQKITLGSSQNIIVEFTNERIIPASGLAVVGALLGKSDFAKKLNRMDVTKNRSQHQIKNGDIILTYIGMLCMGKPYFEAVHEMDDDKEFYKAALGSGLLEVFLQKKHSVSEWMTSETASGRQY